MKKDLFKGLKKFFKILKTSFTEGQREINQKNNEAMIKYYYLLETKLLLKIIGKKKINLTEYEQILIYENFLLLNQQFLNSLALSNLPINYFKSIRIESDKRGLRNSTKLYVKNFILILIELYTKKIYYKFFFLSTIKNFDFFLIFTKMLSKFTILNILREKVPLCYWKIFSIINSFCYLKIRENISLFTLFTIKPKQSKYETRKIKKYLLIYLLSNQNFLVFSIGLKLLPINIYLQIGLFSFLKILTKIKLDNYIFQIFQFTVSTLLVNFCFRKNSNLFTESFLIFNKILSTKKQKDFLEEGKKEYISLCRNIYISLPNEKYNKILPKFPLRLYKIYEEINSNFMQRYKLKEKNLVLQKIYKNNGIIQVKEIFHEFLRDIQSNNYFFSKVKVLYSKFMGKFKKGSRFLPLKIFRNLRIISRSYFIDHLREKQLIWNLEDIRLLVKSSIIFCSKISLFFIRVHYIEALFFLSFNRENFILESEITFLLENNIQKESKIREIEKKDYFYSIFQKNFFLKEKFYFLNTTFQPDCCVLKTIETLESNKIDEDDKKISNLVGDHIYAIEATLMKFLKIKIKIKSNQIFLAVKKKLLPLFSADPRGILIQIKSLNDREYINFSKEKNIYTYF